MAICGPTKHVRGHFPTPWMRVPKSALVGDLEGLTQWYRDCMGTDPLTKGPCGWRMLTDHDPKDPEHPMADPSSLHYVGE